MGIYTNENIKKFVLSGKITAEQYAEITESNYEG